METLEEAKAKLLKAGKLAKEVQEFLTKQFNPDEQTFKTLFLATSIKNIGDGVVHFVLAKDDIRKIILLKSKEAINDGRTNTNPKNADPEEGRKEAPTEGELPSVQSSNDDHGKTA